MIRLMHGDTIEQMRTLPSESFDACVTDPPAGIAFMGRAWDHDKGGRRQWVTWMTEVFTEVYRVMKPGAHGLVWALPRTSHWTACALEDAGFEVRDSIVHLFGSGFPKSLDVSKAIDKAAGRIGIAPAMLKADLRARFKTSGLTLGEMNDACGFEASGYLRTSSTWAGVFPTRDKWNVIKSALGCDGGLDALFDEAEREIVGTRPAVPGVAFSSVGPTELPVTLPATPEAAQWAGWGTALKPAAEIWWLIRKPLSEKTVAANVLKHGTGALNIDAARIGTADDTARHTLHTMRGGNYENHQPSERIESGGNAAGRWPANVVLSHEPECQEVGTRRVKGAGGSDVRATALGRMNDDGWQPKDTPRIRHTDADGLETVPAFQCVESCAVRILDEQAGESTSRGGFTPGSTGAFGKRGVYSGAHVGQSDREWTGFGDTGGPSRFFYTSKASTADRGEYNDHPTVKSTDLMRWLVTLVTPPGGTVLDCFAGSGSTLVAADRLGFSATGIDSDSHALDIARRRLAEDGGMFSEVVG